VFCFHYFGLVLGCGGGFQWRSWGCRAWLRGLLLRASLLGARWGGVLSLAKVCRFLPEFRQVVIVVPLRSIWGCGLQCRGCHVG
jgi:hypothetical protein